MQLKSSTKPVLSEYRKVSVAIHHRVSRVLRRAMKYLCSDDLRHLQGLVAWDIEMELEIREYEAKRRRGQLRAVPVQQPREDQSLAATREQLLRTVQARADQLRGNGHARPQ